MSVDKMAVEQIHEEERTLLEVNDLRVHFQTDAGLLKAVDGISFRLEKGKVLGLVGESGCGKSIASKAILGIHPKHCVRSGEVYLSKQTERLELISQNPKGKVMRQVRGGHISMIFQEPMTALSPLHTIGNQIVESIRLHRTRNKKEAQRIAVDMLRKVGIPDTERKFHQYPHEFSGGMRQRAMIALALACRPELLIADEPTTALDVTIQAQVLELMKDLQKEFGMSIIFITHDLGIVADICDEVAVMYLGKIVEHAPVKEIFHHPKHPYTRGLLRSIPRIGSRSERLESIEGTVPIPINRKPMCGFYERCAERIPGVCDAAEVPDVMIGGGENGPDHRVQCFLYSEEHRAKTGGRRDE